MPKVKVTTKRAATKPSKKPETQQPESPIASPETSLAPTPESSPRPSPERSHEQSHEPSEESSQEPDDFEQNIRDFLKENNCETFTFQKLIKHLNVQDKDDIKKKLKEMLKAGVLQNKNGKPILPGQLMFNENYEQPGQKEVEASEEEESDNAEAGSEAGSEADSDHEAEETNQSSQESAEVSTRQETRKDQESFHHEVANEKPTFVQNSKIQPEIQVFHRDIQTQTEGLTPSDESISDESVFEERETAGDPLESSTPIFIPIRSKIKKKVTIQQPVFEESEDDNTPPTPNPVTPPKRKRERETKKVKNARKKAKK